MPGSTPLPSRADLYGTLPAAPTTQTATASTGFAYPNSQGIPIATWGMVGHDHLGRHRQVRHRSANGEVHANVNTEMVNPSTGLAPNGLNLNQICTYFNAMGGSVVVPPAPNPSPTPTPTPTPSPVSVNVPFGVYNLTITGTAVSPGSACRRRSKSCHSHSRRPVDHDRRDTGVKLRTS